MTNQPKSEVKGDCPNISAYILPWAGKLLHACPEHAMAMTMIGSAIGSPIELLVTTDLLPCEFKDDLKEAE